jgi:hypothetical protein
MKTSNHQPSKRAKDKHQTLLFHLNSKTAKTGDNYSVVSAEVVDLEEVAEPEEEASKIWPINSYQWHNSMLKTWVHKKNLKRKKKKSLVEDIMEELDNGVKKELYLQSSLKKL